VTASPIRPTALFIAFAVAGALPATAWSDPAADFYRGKTITILIGVGAGGEYDLQARLVAKYLGRYIPGNPTLVAQNMTGASGLKMINYLATVAPHDGTYMGMVQNGLPALQAVGLDGVQFDAAQFNWLGAMAPVVETIAVWHAAGVTTVEGARQKEIVTGATARGSITYTFPAMMNELFGTKFKLVTGYTGGNEVNLAMERGEIEARDNTWSSWKATRPDWLREHKIAIIAQSSPRAPDLDAPPVNDLAVNDEQRRIVDLVFSGCALGRPLAITPGVPADRVAVLRAAFDQAVKDPEFLADAKAANFDVDPIHGVDMQKTIGRILDVPPALAAKAKHLLD
jgi:tripartite-type tricarboxylate transporter receptor subunit TctC